MPHLDTARSAPARATATVYRQSAHHLAPLDRPARASQLELTAHRLGCRSLAARIASAAPDRPWQTRWSHGRRATGHQVLTGHTGGVDAVAVGALPDGTPVIVSGGGDGRHGAGVAAGRRHPGRGAAARPRRRGERGGGGGAAGRHPGHRQRRRRWDGTVRVWRLADGTPVGEPLRGHDGRVNAVAVGALPDGTPVIVSGGWDGRCGCGGWPTAPRSGSRCPATPAGVRGGGGALPDGTPVIVSGGDDGTVRVWRLADGTPVGEPLTGHTDWVRAVAVGALPDGTPVIVSGGDDGTVRVWRLADGTPVGEPLRGHTSR